MLTQDQIKANIDSMQKQGASSSTIQDYLNSLKPQSTQSSFLGDVGGAAMWLGNAVASPAESLGVHLGQAAAGATADVAGALGDSAEQNKINTRFNSQPSTTTLTGGSVNNLKSGVGGALQLAGDLGSNAAMLYAPESSGIVKMGLLGAGSGLSQSLAAGNTDEGSLQNDTATGALFGGLLGGTVSALGHGANLLKGLAGVTPQIENEIKNVAPNELDKYFNAAVENNSDASTPSAYGVAEQEARRRATILTNQVIPQAGEQLNALREAAANEPVVMKSPNGPTTAGVDAVNAASDNINNVLQKLTRHQFTSYAEGEAGGLKIENYPEGASTAGMSEDGSGVTPLPGRSVDLSPAESKQLTYLSQQLEKLKASPTVATAMDVKTNINSEVGKWSNPQFGSGNSPVEGVMKYAYGQVSNLIHSVSPEIDDATNHFADLENLKESIGKEAGQAGQNASLMMRRVTSGDQASDIIPILNKLDEVTAPFRSKSEPSLVSHAVMSDWATRNFGGDTAKTLFSQATSEGSSMLGYARAIARTVVKEAAKGLTPDPLEFAKSISVGNPESLNLVTRLAQKAMNSTEAVPLMGQITKGLQKYGISPNNGGPILFKLIKTALFEKLTAPNEK